MLNGLSGLATTLVGVTVIDAIDESAKGALAFVERRRVVPGVAASNGFAGGVNARGYRAIPATTLKFEISPFNTAAKRRGGMSAGWLRCLYQQPGLSPRVVVLSPPMNMGAALLADRFVAAVIVAVATSVPCTNQ